MIFKSKTYIKPKKIVNAIVVSDSSKLSQKKMKWVKPWMFLYGFIILFFISGSLILSAFSESKIISFVMEVCVFGLLTLDYILRFWTCDLRIKQGKLSYLLYIIRPNSIMLLVSLLPSLYLLGNLWGEGSTFTTFENMKFLRIFRLILLLNIFPSLRVLSRVLNNERKTLSIIFFAIILTILLFALAIYSIEEPAARQYLRDNPGISQETAQQDGYIFTYWQAIYYSTITLTTIGFGDFSPHTTMGQVVTTAMSILGVAIVAAPTGIIAGSFMNATKELNAKKRKKRSKKEATPIKKEVSEKKDN